MKSCFKEDKTIIGMLHLKGDDDHDTFRRAVREFEIYRKCGVDAVMVETYFGTYHQAEQMLDYLRKNADGVTYGVNCLNVDAMGFEIGNEYDCQFLQIDSVIGHVKPRDEESIAAFFELYRKREVSPPPTLYLLNKTDLPAQISWPGAMEISAQDGIGIQELIREMESRVQLSSGMEDRMTEERHLRLARRALNALGHAVESIDAGFELDLVEIDLKEALEALSEITGEDASEEVIDRVFKNFCVGK